MDSGARRWLGVPLPASLGPAPQPWATPTSAWRACREPRPGQPLCGLSRFSVVTAFLEAWGGASIPPLGHGITPELLTSQQPGGATHDHWCKGFPATHHTNWVSSDVTASHELGGGDTPARRLLDG